MNSAAATALRSELDIRDEHLQGQIEVHSDHVCKLMEQSTKYLEDVVDGHVQRISENMLDHEDQCREGLAGLEARVREHVAAAVLEAEARADDKMIAFADMVKQAMLQIVGSACRLSEHSKNATPVVEASSGCITLAVLEEQTALAHEALRPSYMLTSDHQCDPLGKDSIGQATPANFQVGSPQYAPPGVSEIAAATEGPMGAHSPGPRGETEPIVNASPEGGEGVWGVSGGDGVPTPCVLLPGADPDGDLSAVAVEPDEYPSPAVFGEDVDYGGDEEEEGIPAPDCSAPGPGPAGIRPDHDHKGLAGSAQDNSEAGQTVAEAGQMLHRSVDVVGETPGVGMPEQDIEDPAVGASEHSLLTRLPLPHRLGSTPPPEQEGKGERDCDDFQEELRCEESEHDCKHLLSIRSGIQPASRTAKPGDERGDAEAESAKAATDIYVHERAANGTDSCVWFAMVPSCRHGAAAVADLRLGSSRRSAIEVPDAGASERSLATRLPPSHRSGLTSPPEQERKRERDCDDLQEELRCERSEYDCKRLRSMPVGRAAKPEDERGDAEAGPAKAATDIHVREREVHGTDARVCTGHRVNRNTQSQREHRHWTSPRQKQWALKARWSSRAPRGKTWYYHADRKWKNDGWSRWSKASKIPGGGGREKSKDKSVFVYR